MQLETVLIVDPHTWLTRLLEYNLSKRGYLVATLADYAAAMDKAVEIGPGVYLVSLQGSVPAGYALVRELRANPSTCRRPVLALLCEADSNAEKQALQAGATSTLTKPFKLSDLLVRLDNCLKHRNAVSLKRKGPAHLIELEGSITEGFNTDLVKAIDCALASPAQTIVLDFSKVRFFDNRHLVLLAGALSRAMVQHSTLRIASPVFGIAAMLEKSGLAEHIPVLPTVAEALTCTGKKA